MDAGSTFFCWACRSSADIKVSILDASPEVLIVETEGQLDAQKIQRELGGTVKIARVVDIVTKRENDSVNFALQNYFKPSKIKNDFLKKCERQNSVRY